MVQKLYVITGPAGVGKSTMCLSSEYLDHFIIEKRITFQL